MGLKSQSNNTPPVVGALRTQRKDFRYDKPLPLHIQQITFNFTNLRSMTY